MKIDLSIVIPALREEKIIGDTLKKVAAYLKTQKFGDVEVVVVAAEAGDKTKEVAQSHADLFKHFRVINSGPRVGKGHDVQTGMLAAKGEKRIFMDADLATPLHHIATMVKALDSSEVVIGARNLDAIHKGFIRSFLSQAGNILIRGVLLPGVTDSQCGFKGFSAEAARTVFTPLKTKGWGFDMEILARARRAKLAIRQIIIGDWHEAREQALGGDSKIGVAVQTLQELGRIKTMLILERWPWLAKLWWLLPAAVLAVATLMYMHKLGEWSIWFDEAFSAWMIRFSPAEIIALTAVDVHPPLYYLILQAWAQVFGESEVGLRSLSVAAMIGALWFGILTVKRMFGTSVAYLTLPFLLFAPFLMRYGQEARMYALASLLCMAATYIFVRVTQKDTTHKAVWWSLYIILVLAGLYTHYYTALIWIVHWVWHWHTTRQAGQKFFSKTWLTVYGIIAVGYLPWAFVFLKQAVGLQAGGFWIGPVSHQTLLNTASNVLVYHQQWELMSWLSVGFMAILVGLSRLFYLTYKNLSGVKKTYFALLLMYAFLPIVILFVLSLPPLRPILIERYFVPAMLAFYLLIGVAMALGPRARHWYESKTLLTTLIIGFLILGVNNLYTVGNYIYNQSNMPRAKPLMQAVEQKLDSNSAVIVNSPYGYYEFSYYSTKGQIYFIDDGSVVGVIGSGAMLIDSPYAVTNLETFGATKDSLWLVSIGEWGQIPAGWQQLETVQVDKYTAVHYKVR